MSDDRYPHFWSRPAKPLPKFAKGSSVISYDEAFKGPFKVDPADLSKPAYQAGKLYETMLRHYYAEIERRLRDLAGAAAEDIQVQQRNFDDRQVSYISTMGVVVAAVAIEFRPRFSQKT
jgi:hypothetical protein